MECLDKSMQTNQKHTKADSGIARGRVHALGGTCLLGRLKIWVFKWDENEFLFFKCEEMKNGWKSRSEDVKIIKSDN